MALIYGILASFFALIFQSIVWLFYPDLFTLKLPLVVPVLISLLFLACSEELARTLFIKQLLKSSASRIFSALPFGIGFAALEVLLSSWNGFSWLILGAVSFHILATFFAFWWLIQKKSLAHFSLLVSLLTCLHFGFNLLLLVFFS